ncbi:MAG: hypothetical protein HYS13_03300 [Planctomycetia bacterium]|nr:hypothetical protein [Planctomycetia bacterium]
MFPRRAILAVPLYLVVFGLADFSLAGPAAAEDKPSAADLAFKQAVTKLLEVGWGKDLTSLKPAGEHFQAAHGAKAMDPRATHAFALAHLKHRRYTDARKLALEAVKLDEKYLPARDLVIWLLMLSKEHQGALAAMNELSQLLPEKPGALEIDEHLDRVRFLGRVFGYLGGPMEGKIDAALVEATRQKITGRLDEAALREFETSLKEVDDKFTELSLSRDQSKEDAEKAQAAAKERQAERLDREKEIVNATKEEIDALAGKAREAVDRAISDLEKKASPLERKLQDLVAQAVPIRRRMADLSAEISRLLARADSTDDPNLKRQLRFDADRLDFRYHQLEREYAGLDREAGRVKGELAGLEQQRQAAVGRYEREMKRLGREASNLRKTASRIDREEDKVREPVSGNTPGVRSASAIVRAFTTYVPFPLEREKQRVLTSLE